MNMKREPKTMKTFLTFVLLCSFMVLMLAHGASAFGAKEELEGILTTFYQASVDEDVDMYMSVLDELYIEQVSAEMGEGFVYAEFVAGTFDYFDTDRFSLDDLQFYGDEASALVTYSLKAKASSKDGEKLDIDNDMIAFFWNYDGEWKLRWTMLRTTFDEKMLADMFNQYIIEDTVFDNEEYDVFQDALDKGIIAMDDYSLLDDEDVSSASSSSGSGFFKQSFPLSFVS